MGVGTASDEVVMDISGGQVRSGHLSSIARTT